MIKKVLITIFVLLLIYFFSKDKVFTDNTITIASSLPKSGINKSWGKSVITGANAYFKYVNEFNILGNKKIKFITYDDKYEPELTQKNIRNLLFNKEVYALFGFVGTPTVKSILPILEETKIPFFAPFTGASFLRKIPYKNIINFRTSYNDEIENIIHFLTDKKKLKKYAVFYQNDDYGEEGYISLIKALNKRNLKIIAEGSYKRNTLSISHAFNEIKVAKPEVIVMVGANKSNALFIKRAKENKNFKNTIFCIISFGDANAMITELKKLKINTSNLIFSQVVPYYKDISKNSIIEYQYFVNRYYPNEEFGFVSLEAFLAAKILVNAISRIKGELTQNKLIYTLKSTYENYLEDIKIKYENNQLLNNVYLFEYLNNEFKEIKYE